MLAIAVACVHYNLSRAPYMEKNKNEISVSDGQLETKWQQIYGPQLNSNATQ